MQVVQVKSVVKLTKQELLDAVWLLVKTEQAVDLAKFDIEVDGVLLFTEQTVNSLSNGHNTQDENGWFSVPVDWEHTHCPNLSIPHNSTIEVILRNGNSELGKVYNWKYCWDQKNHNFDIVKYRVVK